MQRHRVIVADDDSDLRDSLTDILELEGYEAVPARDGDQALALVAEDPATCVLVVDLRILGIGWKDVRLTTLSHETLRITWIGFVCAAITGLMLFCSKATSYVINPYFKLKLVMLAFAGINMVVFQFVTWKSVAGWDLGKVPTAAKVSATLSLLAWICVVFFGRAIGFTLSMFY